MLVLRITGLFTLRRQEAARAPKNRSRAKPLMRVFSATFGAGVNAPHCPITRPKRRKQPERYVQCPMNFLKKGKQYLTKLFFEYTLM